MKPKDMEAPQMKVTVSFDTKKARMSPHMINIPTGLSVVLWDM